MPETEVTCYLIYKGNDLKWIIPNIYLLSDPGSAVYVISPWIDVDVKFSITWCSNSRVFSLLELAARFDKRNVKTVFVFSKDEDNNVINVKSKEMISKHNFDFYFVRNLHAKAVVGQRLMYIGSANITYSGMNRNTEAVKIEKVCNQKDSLRQLIGGSELWQIPKVR